MNKPSSPWQHIVQSFPVRTAEQKAEVREVRPFFILVTLVLAMFAVSTVMQSVSLRAPLVLIAFLCLVMLQIVLHWFSPRVAPDIRWSVAYFVLQGITAFAATLLANDAGVAMVLFIALIGEAVGMLRDVRSKLMVVAGLAGLAVAAGLAVMDGSSLPAWVGSALPVAAFTIIYTYLYIRQAEARAQAQSLLKELESAHQQLSAYAMQVEELTRTAERQRMARELHDTLAQGLAGVVLQLEAVQAHLQNENLARASQISQQAADRARTTLAEARRAIDDLRANRSGEMQLESALRAEVERFVSATGIACEVNLNFPEKMDESTSEHAARICSEGLANIARHARASSVQLEVRHTETDLIFELKDNGMGFDPAITQNQPGHYGLLGMRERARLAGGSLLVESAPGKGTMLSVRLPLFPGRAPSQPAQEKTT